MPGWLPWPRSSLGAVALVKDLGRPERFLNMLRTIKLTSPMSVGSWILSAFSAGAGVAAVAEIDRMTGDAAAAGPAAARCCRRSRDRPAWRPRSSPDRWRRTPRSCSPTPPRPPGTPRTRNCPSCSSSSASLASAGLAMITTPVRETGPARNLAVLGVVGDLVAMQVMERRMDPVAAEPLHQGKAGAMLKWSERLAVAGGLGTLLGGATASRLRLRDWRCWPPRH